MAWECMSASKTIQLEFMGLLTKVPGWLHSDSRCKWMMIQSVLPKQPKSFLNQVA